MFVVPTWRLMMSRVSAHSAGQSFISTTQTGLKLEVTQYESSSGVSGAGHDHIRPGRITAAQRSFTSHRFNVQQTQMLSAAPWWPSGVLLKVRVVDPRAAYRLYGVTVTPRLQVTQRSLLLFPQL